MAQAWQDLTRSGRWPHSTLRQQALPIDTRCQADRALLTQAFASLLEHALIGAGSDPAIEIACHEILQGGQPALAGVDCRCGLPGRTGRAGQLFEPFFFRHSGGSGSAWRSLAAGVELQGGHLEARPAATGGTELVLTLPRRPAEEALKNCQRRGMLTHPGRYLAFGRLFHAPRPSGTIGVCEYW